jgi:cellulose synthase/poly-beta-1,6-N-acetylglucosamine synthase-like glycosyltransferase
MFHNIDLLYWIFTIFSFSYIAIILLITKGLLSLKDKSCDKKRTISIVISARNEEKRITPTLQSLENINYPKDLYEVIIVNDASEDNTAKIIQSFVKKNENWQILQRNEKSDKFHAKKSALDDAIQKAKGELIFTTDADCEILPNWLTVMSCYFTDNVSMVLGNSNLKTKNRFLHFDNFFSTITAAAPTKLGFPISSVGRNIAFKKSVYQEVGGYLALTNFKSGDDVHLTERFRMKTDTKIEYCAHHDTFTYSLPPSTFKEILNQQIRKNSKILNKSISTASFSVMLFFIYNLVLFYPLIQHNQFKYWATITLFRLILEFIALTIASVKFRVKFLIPIFPIFQIFYPLYLMVMGIIGSLHLYKWKQ